MKISRKNFAEFFVLLLFRILVDLVYDIIIVPHYSYQKFVSNQTAESTIISYLLIIIGNIILLKSLRKKEISVSKIVVLLLYLLSFVPFSALLRFGLLELNFVIANIIYWVCIFIFYNLNIGKEIKFSFFDDKKMSEKFVYIIGSISILIVVYISARYTHFRFHFGLMDVYELRAESRTYNLPTIISYLFGWSRSVNSLMIGYSLLKNNKPMALLFSFSQLLSFGIDGMKTSIFMPLIVIVLYFYRERIKEINFTIWSGVGLSAVSIIALIQNMILKKYTIGYMAFYRTMILPVRICSYYWDFFTHHTPDYFKSSFLRHLGFQSQYSEYGIMFMISGVYSNDYSGAANTGMIADAVTNLGVPGIVIMPFFLIIVLKLFDRCSKNQNSILIICVAAQFAVILINNFLTISLLTQGGFAMMILLLFMEPEQKNNYEE